MMNYDTPDPGLKILSQLYNILTVLAWLAASIFIVMIRIHLHNVGIETEQYKKADFCQSRNECRRTIEAEIVESYTSINDGSYRYRRRYDTDTYPKILFYSITTKFASGETYTIMLKPHLKINVEQFGIDNVYLPAPPNGYEKMAEASFIKGHLVKLEIWKNKPSIIYSMYVLGAPRLSGRNEYAIPTEDNPIIYELRQNIFWTWVILLLIVLPLILSVKIIIEILHIIIYKILEKHP